MTARQLYRREYHLKNRESQNAKNRERYHAKYKRDQREMERRRRAWRAYAKSKGPMWVRSRSKKYKKPVVLTEAQLIKKREAYNEWAKKNWARRVEYARLHRRRHPLFGFKSAARRARDTGDFRELSAVCLKAIVSTND